MRELEHFEKCKKLIIDKLENGKPEEWTNKNFVELSEKLYLTTHIIISSTTLKRIFGRAKTGKRPYLPQEATLDALVKFIGFKNWSDFTTNENERPVNSLANKKTKKNIKDKKYLLIVSSVFIIGLIAVVGLLSVKPDYKFKIEKTNDISPSTVMAKFDISNLQGDDFMIDFYTRKINIKKDDSIVSNFLGVPEYFHVKLIQNKTIIDSFPVFIKNNKWQLFDSKQKEIKISNLIQNGCLQAKPADIIIKNPQIDTLKKFYTEFRLFKDFNVQGDSMTLKTRLKNPDPAYYENCNDVLFIVKGAKNNIQLHFAQKGCAYWIKTNIQGIFYRGRTYDQEKFEVDFAEFKDLMIETKNKNIKISIDNQQIIQYHYTKPIGKIKGFIISFHQTGMVDYFKLYNHRQQAIYVNEFDDTEPL